jgi:acyl-CoA synthetase (AMP-forming)/AMP-acid ligase II
VRRRILVRGPLGHDGYARDPSTPAEAKAVLERYVDTGYVGYFDTHGRLFLSGRSDDMIVSGGENVLPGEVEDALAQHHTVADVVVVGVDDPISVRFSTRSSLPAAERPWIQTS